jgi:hypothetical protein
MGITTARLAISANGVQSCMPARPRKGLKIKRKGIRKQKRLHPAAEEGMAKQNSINIIVFSVVLSSGTSLPTTTYTVWLQGKTLETEIS